MRNRKIFILWIFVLLTTLAYAQGPDDPTEEDPDDSIPIGQVEVLLAVGILFGVRKIMVTNASKKETSGVKY